MNKHGQLEMNYGPQGSSELPGPTLADHLRQHESDIEHEPDVLEQRDDRVGRAFAKYHKEHPEVYDKLVAFARRYRDAGVRRGMQYFIEVLRHEHLMATRDAQGFKVNNDYAARYARLIERNNEDLRGFFRKRRLTARGAGIVERAS